MAIENGLMSSPKGEVWSEGLRMGRVYGVWGRGRERRRLKLGKLGQRWHRE